MNKFVKFLGKNRPSVLTFVGLGGLVATAVMAYKSAEVVQMKLDTAWNLKISEDPECTDEDLTRKEKAWVYVKTLWPTFTLGAISSVLVVLGHMDGISRKNAALAAYYISESTLKDYQAEVVKELGEKKEREVRDRVGEKRLNDLSPTESTIVVSDNSSPWVCDTATGLYFRMGYEKLRRVIAETNLELLKRDYISIADFYEKLGVELPPGDRSLCIGWNSQTGEIDPYFTSAVREINGERVPCMVMEYRVQPYYDFDMYGR